MFNPDRCFCCEPPEDPCTMTGCTWSSTDMSDTDLTAGTTYNNPASGSTPDGTYEVTNVQDTSTGNDAPCRKITIETAIAPSKAESVYAICWKDNATHNPSTQCPLTNVSFCVESKRHTDADSGLTDGVVFVVRQNGKIYATTTQAVGVNWKRASGTYTSASFTWVNGTGNPNFTATGASIEFGFALKLSVPKDGTPYDVVMFDNLCISRFAGCGGTPCPPVNCDSYNTGDPLAVDSQASETNYSVDPLIGLPAESHKYEFPINSQQKSVTSILSSDVFSGMTCTTPSSVQVCVNHQSDVPVGNPSGNGHSILFRLRQGAVSVSFGQIFIPGDSSGVWGLHSATYTFPVSTAFNFSNPVELLMTVSGGNRTAIGVVWIDNICVKAAYGACSCECVDDYHVNVSGAYIKVPGLTCTYTGTGCSASDGSYVLTKSAHASVNVPACSYKSPFVPLGVCPFYETNNGVRFAWVLTPFEINGNITAILKLTAVTWTGSTSFANYNVARFDCPDFSCESGGVFTGYSSGEMTDGWMYACGGPSSLTVSAI